MSARDEPEFVLMLRRMGYQAAYLDVWLPTLTEWQDDEILDEVERTSTGGLGGWSVRARRLFLAALADYRPANRAAPVEPRRRDPRQMFTAEEVDAARRELVAKGEPSGERSIAKKLGGSRDAVRYALGKDRRD